MRKLSVRSRGNGYWQVGPAGHGPTAEVAASNGRDALRLGKALLKERGQLGSACAASFRDNKRANTRYATTQETLEEDGMLASGGKGRRR